MALSGRAELAAKVAAIVIVTAIGLGLRLHAVGALPIDFDEDDYVRAGQLYAEGFRAGDATVVFRENYRPEHPPLTKLLTGLAYTALDPVPLVPDLPTTAAQAASLPQPQLDVGRGLQALFGTLAVLGLALLDPLAGLLLAAHTWTIKYTSQVMLEAVPAALSLLAVLAYLRSTRSSRPRRWLAAAAIAFGLACAGKYLYGVAGLAIVATWLAATRPTDVRAGSAGVVAARVGRWLAPVGAWLLLAFVAFLAADPYVWPDPIGRLGSSIAYHGGYATSEAVQDTGWPMWQPLVWLSGSVPFHPPGTFLVSFDLLISMAAVIGLPRLWSRYRVMAVWLGLAVAFLLLWPTKWPQYVLVLTAPLSLSAALGIRAAVLEPVGRRLRSWRSARRSAGARRRIGEEVRNGRRAMPWLLPGLIALTILVTIPIVFELAMSLTDFSAQSIRDGVNGGVMRAAVGGLLGQVPQQPFDPGGGSNEVGYVGFDLLGAFSNGVWFGDNTSAAIPAFSVFWAIPAVLLQTALGLGVALLLARPGVRFANAWRVLFLLPWAIPEFVGAIAWGGLLSAENGAFALLLGRPLPWNQSPELSLVVLLVVSTWLGFPLMMLVATAGLKTIPASTVEAAALDGAGGWTRLRRVILPLLLPLLAPAMVIRGLWAFNQLYLILVLQPSGATTTGAAWSFFVFDSSSGAGLFAVSAAVNILTIVGLAVLVGWFLNWRERSERAVVG